MKKHILFYTILFFAVFPSCSRTQNIAVKIEVEANAVKLLSDTANTKNNKALNSILSELESKSDTSVSSLIKSFGEKLKKNNLRIENFYNITGKNFSSAEEYLNAVINNAVSEDVNIIKRRFENSGIENAVVNKSGSRRITIELTSLKNNNIIKDIIETKGSLRFYIVKEIDTAKAVIKDIDKALEKSNPGNGSDQFSKLINFELSFGLNKFPVNSKSKKEVEDLLEKDEVQKILSQDIKILWYNGITKTMTDEYKTLYFLKKNPELTGKVITETSYSIDNSNSPVVFIKMNDEGAAEWEKFTEANINRECAIVIDNIVYSAPRIMSKITGGNANISGMSSLDDAKNLSILLQSGELKIPLKIIPENNK